MTNEGLKFGALALGIALVILIIVLVVRHHKDKYEDVDSGRLKDIDGGCCSLTNNTGTCGAGTGDPWTLSAGCLSAKDKNLPSAKRRPPPVVYAMVVVRVRRLLMGRPFAVASII